MARASLLERSLALLRCFRECRVWRFGELAERLPVSEPTLSAMLAHLVAGGWLDKRADGYHLGAEVLTLGGLALARLALRAPARPVMLALREELGETVELSVPNGDGLLFVDQVEGPDELELFVYPGRFVLALHAFAPGKLVLACRDPEWRAAFYRSADFHAESDATILDPEQIEAQGARSRDSGFAEDIDEARVGVTRVACAIQREGDLLGALSVVAPSARLPADARRRAQQALGGARDRLLARLGA